MTVMFLAPGLHTNFISPPSIRLSSAPPTGTKGNPIKHARSTGRRLRLSRWVLCIRLAHANGVYTVKLQDAPLVDDIVGCACDAGN